MPDGKDEDMALTTERSAVDDARATRLRRVALGADHEGHQLKDKLVAELREERHTAKEHGVLGGGLSEAADPADIVSIVAQAVLMGEAELAVVVCGSGAAASILANRIPGIRAASCQDTVSARDARQIADANMLCLSARVLGPDLASEIVRVWLASEFSGNERHQRLLLKIEELEDGFDVRRRHPRRAATPSAGHADS